MIDVTLSAHFGNVAATWADSIMEEFGDKPAEFIRELVDTKIILQMVEEVCKACDERAIRNPDVQQSYAQHAVAQFDKRLTTLMDAQRQKSATVH